MNATPKPLPDLTTLLDDYATELRATRKAEGTITQRLGDLHRFQQATGVHPLAATTTDLRNYLAQGSQTRSWAAEYMKRIRGSFRTFYTWAHNTELRDDNPALALATITVRSGEHKREPAPEPVIKAASQQLPTPLLQLIFTLAATLGLRRTEIASLKLSDRHGDILWITGKGNRLRKIPVDTYTLSLLHHRERELGFPTYYFPGRFTGHLDPSTIARWIKPYLDGHCLHSLRHRAATIGYQRTHDLRAVQDLLGHASVATTQSYVATTPDAIRRVVETTTLSGISTNLAPAPLGPKAGIESLLAEASNLASRLQPHGWTLTLTHLTNTAPQPDTPPATVTRQHNGVTSHAV